jgi:thiol-disulfide isomerase/thioredoxin
MPTYARFDWPTSDLRSTLVADGRAHGGRWSMVLPLASDAMLLNLWASWCVPCRETLAVLAAYAERPSSIPALGVNVKESTSAGLAFMAEIGVQYTSLYDSEKARRPCNGRCAPRPYSQRSTWSDPTALLSGSPIPWGSQRTTSRRPSTGSSTPAMRNSRTMSTIPPADALRYRYAMRSGLSRRTRQVLLLCALALSVIGMHHVPLSPHVTMSVEAHAGAMPEAEATSPVVVATPQARPAGGSGTGVGHDLLHMCLAVLYAAGGFLFLAWLLASVTGGAPALKAGLRPWSRRFWRPPRPAGRSLLTFVCVLRT